jgi:hypothetical protein
MERPKILLSEEGANENRLADNKAVKAERRASRLNYQQKEEAKGPFLVSLVSAGSHNIIYNPEFMFSTFLRG